MKREDALAYVGGCVDDALSTHEQPVTRHTTLVGWQCGFEPMFVAVNSYLPECVVDAVEAEELAMDMLLERNWFGDRETPARESDYIFVGENHESEP